jgi:hypothetical protein
MARAGDVLTDGMPYRDAPPDSGPLAVCLECFHAPHDDVCPECRVHCKARRRRRLALGALRVLYAVVGLLLAIVVLFVGLIALQEGLTFALRGFGTPALVALMILTVVLRWKRSQYLAAALDSNNPR